MKQWRVSASPEFVFAADPAVIVAKVSSTLAVNLNVL